MTKKVVIVVLINIYMRRFFLLFFAGVVLWSLFFPKNTWAGCEGSTYVGECGGHGNWSGNAACGCGYNNCPNSPPPGYWCYPGERCQTWQYCSAFPDSGSCTSHGGCTWCSGVYGNCTGWSPSCGQQSRTCYDTSCGRAQTQYQNGPSCNQPPNTPYRWGTDIGYNAWTNSSSLQMGMIGTDPNSNMNNLYYQIQYYNPNSGGWGGYNYNWASNLGYFANYGSSIYTYTTFGFPDGVYRYGAYGYDNSGAWSGFGGYYGNNYRDGTAPGSWTNLTNGGTYSGTINVTVTGLDRWNPYGWGENYNGSWPYHNGSGLSCLYLAIDGAQWTAGWCGVGDNGSRSYSWTPSPGSHHIQTYAVDNAGNGRWWEDKWVTVNPPPTMNSVTINSSNVVPNNSTQYTISATGSDPNGAGDIIWLGSLINYQGENAGNYRGYLIWGTTDWYPGQPDHMACSGGGYAVNYSGYGNNYIHLKSCSVSGSGNSRTANFVVTFDPSFTSPLIDNDISGYVYDSLWQYDSRSWVNFQTNFNLSFAPTIDNVTINSSTVKPDNTTQYTISATGSDGNGSADIFWLGSIINYGGENAGSYRGYLIWGLYDWYPGQPDHMACSGGGYAVNYSGYGNTYTHLKSCSVSGSGNSRTASFVVTFDPSFTSPLIDNDISGYVYDTQWAGPAGWTNFQTNFNLQTWTVTGTAGAGGTISPATRTVLHGQTTTFTVTPSAGYSATASGCGGSLSGTTFTTGAITAACTITATFAPTTGIVSGTLFNDINGDGLVNGSDAGSGNATLSYLGLSGGSGSVTLTGGAFSLTLLPDRYRISVGPASFWQRTRWMFSGDTSGRSYKPSGDYTYNSLDAVNPDYPLIVTAGGTVTANLGIQPVPAGNLTINIYLDANGNGILDGSETSLNSPVKVTCSPADVNCPASNNVTRTLSLILAQGNTYTVGYDAAGSAPYQYVKDIKMRTSSVPAMNGSTCVGSCVVTLTASEPNVWVDFLVSNNTAPWIQIWDGDAYSGNAINIHVNSAAASPHNNTISFVMATGTNTAGGLVRAAGSVDCNTFACSERGWQMAGSDTLVWLDDLINLITASTGDIFLNNGSLTLRSSSDILGKKIAIVKGDLTIDASSGGLASVGSGENPDLTALLIATGNITVTGASGTNELAIKGGLVAKGGVSFNYDLSNNSHPGTLVIFDPAVFTVNVPSLSLPTYTWREVVAL